MKSPSITFTKANACGNDFLIVEGVDHSSRLADSSLAELSRKMCDRHRGIGADGVEWLFSDSEADACARLFNADGSEAEISGNGTRCVAAYLYSKTGAKGSRQTLTIRTGAGVKNCRFLSHNGWQYQFELGMSQPVVEKELCISLPSGTVKGIPVSMGNPHYVVFMREFDPAWQTSAAEIGRLPEFEKGVNVEFVVVKDSSNIEVRFFERGAGATQSSGTGSCAAAVAAIVSENVTSPVNVHAPGGMQVVRWDKEVFLTGAAELICRGDFFV